jgi:hypothetical protein
VNFHENQFGGKRMDLGWQDVLTGMTKQHCRGRQAAEAAFAVF